jgi:hypothetical protein
MLVLAVALQAAAVGCGGESRASCTDMRAELASIDPVSEAWNDLNEVQKSLERADKLKSDIAERCS